MIPNLWENSAQKPDAKPTAILISVEIHNFALNVFWQYMQMTGNVLLYPNFPIAEIPCLLQYGHLLNRNLSSLIFPSSVNYNVIPIFHDKTIIQNRNMHGYSGCSFFPESQLSSVSNNCKTLIKVPTCPSLPNSSAYCGAQGRFCVLCSFAPFYILIIHDIGEVVKKNPHSRCLVRSAVGGEY